MSDLHSVDSENSNEINTESLKSKALTTPFEKVINILHRIKSQLNTDKNSTTLISDLDWAIEKIQSHKLYTYENQESEQLTKLSENQEVKSFLDHLNYFSESKEIIRRNKNSKTTLSTLSIPNNQRKMKTDTSQSRIRDVTNHSTLKIGKSRGLSLEKEQTISFSPNNKESLLKINNEYKKEENSSNFIETQKKDILDLKIVENQESLSINQEIIFYTGLEKIFDFDFNIFDLEEKIGKSNVFIEGFKTLIENMDMYKLISVEYLDNFLIKVRDGYIKTNPYHNELHGLDVCQGICIYLTKSNLIDIIHLSEQDVFAFVLSALVHDIGHPGLNNLFQINSMSEVALIYNDKSVLESFHIAEAFKILRRDDCNILSKFDTTEFKTLRKRMIETILATDMVFHAKVQSLVKNRLSVNNIKFGTNCEKLININSSTIFDDQQEIINFLLHTADISHNSRSFKISEKWTYFVMEEFWTQGDLEKAKGLPISFLCDRQTADVPRSQIGFITSIIIPTFDVLVDMLPSLDYFRQNVYTNVECWRAKIKDGEQEHK
jgi:hypothetical protein